MSIFVHVQSEKKTKIIQQLSPYLPIGFEEMVADLLIKHPVRFAVKNPRNTKLGDYRPPMPQEKHHRISINGNLNRYSFLVTTLHEFAHLETYLVYQNRVSPHGEEWKNAFRQLLWPAISSGLLPKNIEVALVKSLTNMKASSCTDTQLSRVLREYDTKKEGEVVLEEIPKNATFVLQGREFIKGELRRTRYMCKETSSKRIFLIHTLATVNLIENNE